MSVVTYVNAGTLLETSNSQTVTPALPSGIVAGNLLIVVAGGHKQTATVFTWGAGWTPLTGSYVTTGGIFAAYRIATGADTAPTLTGNIGLYFGAQVFQYSGTIGIGGFISAASDVAADVTPGFVTQQANSTLAYHTASYAASGDTIPTGFTRDLRTVLGSVQVATGRNPTIVANAGTTVPSISFNRGTYGGTFHLELLPATYSVQTIPQITATGYAYSNIASSATIPSITASGTMDIPPTIPLITASGTAASATGTSSKTLPATTATNTAEIWHTGTFSKTMTAFVVSMDGLQQPLLGPTITASGTAEIWHAGFFDQTLQTFTLDMTGVQQPPLVMENFIVSMVGHAGDVSTMDLRMEQFTVSLSSDPFGEIVGEMYGFDLSMLGLNGGIGAMAGATQYLTSGMTGYGQVTGAIIITPQAFSVFMSADTGVGLNYTTLSMHTEWQALTQYTNYSFNSFARFNNVSLGANSTGLYRLTGDTDAGAAIAAIARVGISDMGTSHLKKAEFVYVGCRAKGDLLLRINTNDSHVRDYRIKHNGETGLHVKRVKLGKGVVARYWQFEIQNIDGADFDLNTLEIKPTVLSRRISSGRA